MPTPNAFISSTFYDLRYIRENLKFFVRSLGYNPILSEGGAIFYDPERSAANAAVAEVANSQLFVLIIGGRFGTELPDAHHSVTNAEYREAVSKRIPIFALIEQGAHSDYEVWRVNQVPTEPPIEFPNVDDTRVLEFVDEVRGQAVNNALVPFRDFEDIQSYLRQQWAGMFHSFLLGRNQARRVEETLGALELIGRRVEVLSTQILKSVGSAEAKATAELYDWMLGSRAVQDMGKLGLRPTPGDILCHKNFFECTEALGGQWDVEPEEAEVDFDTSYGATTGSMSFPHAGLVEEDYAHLRNALQTTVDEAGIAIDSLTITEKPLVDEPTVAHFEPPAD